MNSASIINRKTIAPGVHSRGKSSHRSQRAQTMVEFAFILPLFLILMLGVVQMILVGAAALAVNQAAVACARYASITPAASQSDVTSYLKDIASPLISDGNLKDVELNPRGPRSSGESVSVTLTYDLSAKLFLGSSFFGITFPNQIVVKETMISE